jgi:tripartite-type tricarboxylate transporter receptor subunit TctC
MYQMFGTRSRRARLAWAVGAIATLSLSSACGVLGSPEPESGADPAAAFQGKTMTWVVAYEAGDSQDIAARLIAEFFTKHLPGNPTIEVQNMPGGGGLSALQYVHKANADGLTLLFAGGSPPTEQLLKPYRPDATFVDFDISSFKWIGGTGKESNAVWTNTESGITNVDQLVASTKRVKGAATRPGSNTYMFISLLKEVTGAPIDIVTGYESGSDSALALFRNEVQLQGGTWSTLVNNHQGAPSDVLRPLVVLGKDVPDDAVSAEFKGMTGVPLIEELTTDETKKALIKAAIGPLDWGRLLAAPPNTDPAIVEALRDAFIATGDDPGFAEGLKQRKLSYELVRGDQVEKLINDYLATPEPMVRQYLKLLGEE